jgi:hypothetical protein
MQSRQPLVESLCASAADRDPNAGAHEFTAIVCLEVALTAVRTIRVRRSYFLNG